MTLAITFVDCSWSSASLVSTHSAAHTCSAVHAQLQAEGYAESGRQAAGDSLGVQRTLAAQVQALPSGSAIAASFGPVGKKLPARSKWSSGVLLRWWARNGLRAGVGTWAGEPALRDARQAAADVRLEVGAGAGQMRVQAHARMRLRRAQGRVRWLTFSHRTCTR